MARIDSASHARFYFSLPRVAAKIAGGDSERSEDNWTEANVVGWAVYLVSYIWARERFLFPSASWKKIPELVLLAFAIWIFWLLILYLNSLIIKILRRAGFFRARPDRDAQSMLILVLMTLFACDLALQSSWSSIVGWIWIAALTLNFAAAAFLAVSKSDGCVRN